MADRWAVQARTISDCQGPAEQQAIHIIQDLLEGKIEPQSAAETFATTYEPRIRTGAIDGYYLWTPIYEAIINLGDNISYLERLVHMIITLSKLPDVVDDGGEAIESKLNKDIFWRDIPGFAFHYREYVMGVENTDRIDDGRAGISWDAQISHFINGNTFAALYLRALEPSGPERDILSMKNHAVWTISEAVEVATDTPERLRRSEIYVPSAAKWILIAGRNVYKCSQSKHNNDGEPTFQRWIGGADGGDLLWTGEEGYSVERWNFWRKRFAEISQLNAKEIVTRSASKAVLEMEIIEKEFSS